MFGIGCWHTWPVSYPVHGSRMDDLIVRIRFLQSMGMNMAHLPGAGLSCPTIIVLPCFLCGWRREAVESVSWWTTNYGIPLTLKLSLLPGFDHVTISCHPFCLPQEFTLVIISAVSTTGRCQRSINGAAWCSVPSYLDAGLVRTGDFGKVNQVKVPSEG